MTPTLRRLLAALNRHHGADGSDGTPGPTHPGTCDASARIGAGMPLGPCVLRHGHDGPLHQDARGAAWAHLPPADTTAEN